jgi:hypothetical protein
MRAKEGFGERERGGWLFMGLNCGTSRNPMPP